MSSIVNDYVFMYEDTHTFNGLFRGLARWASTRKVKPIWILLKQETVSGSGISWAICKSAPRSRQITTSAPHCSVFYRLDALPAAQPTVPKHWRHSEYTQHTHPFNITISFWGIQLTRWNTLSQNDSFSSSGFPVWRAYTEKTFSNRSPKTIFNTRILSLCFDAVGWAAGRASGL